ncbi:hypothetical protein C0991_008585 [Blastosporella zonata]|nr:hypothetical protein C0991_008585 [Blastosporella zonata]
MFDLPIRKLSIPTFREYEWSTSSNFEEEKEDNAKEEDESEDEDEDSHKDDKKEAVEENEDLDDTDGESDQEAGDARSGGFLEEKEEEMSEDEDEAEDDEKEDPDAFLGIKKFNAPHVFGTYLGFVHRHTQGRQCPTSDESSEDDEELLDSRSTPALVHSNSSPISSSPISSSSVAFPSSPSFVRSSNRRGSLPYDPYMASLSTLTSLSTTAYTPAPRHAPWQRRRIKRIEKRMEKYKKAWLCSKDEEADDTGDQSDNEGKPAPPKGNWRTKLNRRKATDPIPLPPLWVKPKLKAGEIWDPFGDEIEV